MRFLDKPSSEALYLLSHEINNQVSGRQGYPARRTRLWSPPEQPPSRYAAIGQTFSSVGVPLLRLGIFIQRSPFFGGLARRGVPDGFSAPDSHASRVPVWQQHGNATAGVCL
jgi:hypothetical protein